MVVSKWCATMLVSGSPTTGLRSLMVNISSDKFGKLDALSYEELLRQVQADLKQLDNRFSAELADALDTLFTVKFVRLMRAPSVPADAMRDLDKFIAKLCRDVYRPQLNAYPAHYAARWSMLRNGIATWLRIEETQSDERLIDTGSRDPWELVAEMVLSEGEEVTWSSVKERLRLREVGPQSGGGVSQLLSVMRAHGWIDAVQLRGNKSILISGKNISESQAWRTKHAMAPIEEKSVVPDKLYRTPHRMTEIIRRGTIFNQGALLDFTHVAHEMHRRVRLNQDRLDSAGKHSPTLWKNVFASAREMNQALNLRTQRIVQQNFELLRQHFRDRHPILPRMSLVLCQRERDSDIFTYAYARDSNIDYGCESSRIRDNSGFEHVVSNGAYYLNNDIPASALEGNYRNPRFDMKFLQELRERYSTKGMKEVGLNDWLSIWKDGSSLDTRCRYKSTFIVPLTLRTENLSEEFNVLLDERLRGHLKDGGHASQLILGFLCLDHASVDYFDSGEDVELVHVFASLLSMYVFNRIMLTDLSTTYNRCLEQCSDSQREQLQEVLLNCNGDAAPSKDWSLPYFDLGATTSSNVFTVPRLAG